MVLTNDEAFSVLSDLLKDGKLSIFAGSGISVDSGLPNWDHFIDKYIEICTELNESLDSVLQFSEIIDDAKDYKKKNVIEAITALKDKVKECQERGADIGYFDDALNKIFYSANCNLNHEAIVSTSYRHIITTNYDSLLEEAAKKLGYISLLTRSYSYNDYQKISAAIYSDKTAIIHAHGKIADLKLDQFVLTKQDYLNIMKHCPGFRMIINTIFITSSVLFTGYGGSDPHFEDIIDDLNVSLNWNNSKIDLPKCYIMARKEKISPIREYLNGNNRIDILAFDNHEQQTEFLQKLADAFPREK